MPKIYHTRYTFEPQAGAFTRDELGPDEGACDAFVFVSMLYQEDGSYSQQVATFDGRDRGEPLAPEELFKVWCLLATELSGREDLSEGRRDLCARIHRIVADAVMASRETH